MVEKITPHKGGRTVKRSTDVTPETDEKLHRLRGTHGISLGDLVEWAAQTKLKEMDKDPARYSRKGSGDRG